uniref:Coat protein n=1 Tax=Leviviridae sp. TaxID=2027243 RepID=A0A514D7D2_9VIRU|nr:MAG: hypothetical protein H3BulkL171406e3117_000002 [Leviviridae sp.]
MSLADPLVLKDAAAADVTFPIQSVIAAKAANDPTGTIRVDAASAPTTPRLLTIKQQVTGKGSARVRRTLVSLTQDKLSAAGVPSRMVINLSIAYPLNGDFTQTDANNGIAIVGDLVGGAVTVDTTKVANLLQGQS